MKSVHLLTTLLLATATVAPAASAQSYPGKPVRNLTPFSAGSGPGAGVRMTSDKLGRQLGQPVIVDNRLGGNGSIALSAAKKIQPDGCTLAQMDDAQMSLPPHLYKKVPYDALKDFEPVNTLYRTNFFVVSANSPLKSVRDLVEVAKAKPDGLTYGSWLAGSPDTWVLL